LAAIAWALAAPAATLMLMMLLLPAASVFVVALSDWQLGNNTIALVGLANFRDLAGDRIFWISLGNTFVYAAVVIPISMVLGLALALLIESKRSGRGTYSAAFFLPYTASLVAMALVWQMLLHPSFGPVNTLLGLFGFQHYDFLHDPAMAIFTLAAIGIWQLAGYTMLLYLAGLRAIPEELYQAAAVDGAVGSWSRFWLVTWPQLGPTTLFVLVITTITAFQVFETVATLTHGGPGHSTEVLLYTIYNEAFANLRTNYAAAMMIVFLVILCGAILLKIRLLDREVHYA
jgi:multiple sugar transport system permease protein